MKSLYISLLSVFFFSSCVPVQPVSFQGRQEVKDVNGRGIESERKTPQPDKFPEFRYRPGSGLTIMAPDKTWVLRL